jgi:proton glutamate symport protein
LLKEPILLAFTTTSSDAAMPDAMKRLISFGVPKQIGRLGDAAWLLIQPRWLNALSGGRVGFCCTGRQGRTFGRATNRIMVTLMLTSKGMAGIPRASQVILAGTLVTFNLPVEAVILIIGVDELMDMARTTVNLVGNCLATTVVARWEGQLNLSGPTVTEMPARSGSVS